MIDGRTIPLSVLDLVLGTSGRTVGQSLGETLETARRAERLGFRRYWLAEHHGIAMSLSAATSVLIGAVAAATTSIRVGSGGVMLPNHPALRVAEDFGTLDNLYPDRIDLGLGRGAGARDDVKAMLRGDRPEDFPAQVAELAAYFDGSAAIDVEVAAGRTPPMWILGSGLGGASLAAERGLPFAYAHNINPANLEPATELYRKQFQPSKTLSRPYVLVCAGVLCTDTEEQAQRLRGPVRESYVSLASQAAGSILTPEAADAVDAARSPEQRAAAEAAMTRYLVGTPGTVATHLAALSARGTADELMILTIAHDLTDRLRSLELLAGLA
ncbi:LLM class flavin-dependent oxidoreductase [Actinoplanes sp. CA-054009]